MKTRPRTTPRTEFGDRSVVVCVSDVIDFVELAPSNSTSRMGLKINHKAYCDPSPS